MAKIINKKAAGIDIAAKEHFVCVPHEDVNEDGIVRSFGSYTKDLNLIADWLEEHEITTVAMESTGIYWMELFFVLQKRGFTVILVNAHHIKNVPGRKTDVLDAQWIQKLHSYGFLNGSYQPENIERSLRTYVRRRREIIRDMSKSTNRQIKALEQMNLKLKQVLSDTQGKSGRAIIKAILSGEREATNFLKYKHHRIKASDEDFVNALEGNWKEEQLYLLGLEDKIYNFLKLQLEALDSKIAGVLEDISETMENKRLDKKVTKTKNSPNFHATNYLATILKVDVTAIYGISEIGALTILSETGCDIRKKFKTEKQFLSWLNLVPDIKVSGGKVLSTGMRKKKNRAGQAFREAAATLWRSKHPLGEKLRSKKAKKGAGPAVVSVARTLASIYYIMVVKEQEFDVTKLKNDREKQLLRKINFYERKALEMRSQYDKEVA